MSEEFIVVNDRFHSGEYIINKKTINHLTHSNDDPPHAVLILDHLIGSTHQISCMESYMEIKKLLYGGNSNE